MSLRWLLAPLVALYGLIAGSPEHRAYDRMVSRVEQSVVRVTGTLDSMEGPLAHTCSGEVIAYHLVLTAAHCLMDEMKVDDWAPRGVLRYDAYFDLAVIDVAIDKPTLRMRAEPLERFEPLTALGYAYGWQKLTVLSVRPYLLNVSFDEGPQLGHAPGIFVQGAYVGGMSGGPVVDSNGLMVSIVQRAGDGTGYGVTVDAIHTFLAGIELR